MKSSQGKRVSKPHSSKSKDRNRAGFNARSQRSPSRETPPTHQNSRTTPFKSGLPKRDDLLMGRNCIEEVLAHKPETLLEVWLAESASLEKKDDRRGGLLQSLKDKRIKTNLVDRSSLDKLVQSESHQGVVAQIKPRLFQSLEGLIDSFEPDQPVLFLALDNVIDPHNFGAVLRAAECFGVDAVIWSKNRTAPLGAVVSKSSVGASELVALAPVANLHRALETLKAKNFWVVGAAVGQDAVPLTKFEFPNRAVIVMGSEGEGIAPIIEKNLDFKVEIPMLGVISSLNISQATAVFLSEAVRQRQKLQK